MAYGLLFVAAKHRWPGIDLTIFAVLFAVSAIALHGRLDKLRDAEQFGRTRILVPAAMSVAGLVLIVLFLRASIESLSTDGWGFLGASLCYLGFGQLLAEARSWPERPGGLSILILVSCAFAFVIGLLVISSGIRIWALLLLLGALLLAPVGLSLLTADRLKRESSARKGPTWLWAGIVLLILSVYALWKLAGMDPPFLWATALVIFVLLGLIAMDNNSDVVIVVIAVAIVWSLAPRDVPYIPSVMVAHGESAIVALGDSYMSGEGAKRFFEGTNNRNQNECRRAPTAFAPKVVQLDDNAIPDHLVFLACSGAKAKEVYDTAQYPGEPINDGTPDVGLNQLADYDWVSKSADVQPKLVLITIGGNDAKFGEIGRTCVLLGDCAEIGARWLKNLNNVGLQVRTVFEMVRRHFPDIPVVAIPYPIPISETRCSWSSMTSDEHLFLHEFVHELDAVIQQEAENAGLYYLKEMESSLAERNLRICDAGPSSVGVNFLARNPISGGSFEQRVNPQYWFHNSLHPNDRGHTAMSETLKLWIDEHRAAKPAQPSINPHQHDVRTIGEIMGAGFDYCGKSGSKLSHCDGSVSDWTAAQVTMGLWRGLAPLLAMGFGAWLFWLQIIRMWKSRRRNTIRS
jgi:lysophospholipase L1-like esterase